MGVNKEAGESIRTVISRKIKTNQKIIDFLVTRFHKKWPIFHFSMFSYHISPMGEADMYMPIGWPCPARSRSCHSSAFERSKEHRARSPSFSFIVPIDLYLPDYAYVSVWWRSAHVFRRYRKSVRTILWLSSSAIVTRSNGESFVGHNLWKKEVEERIKRS